MHRTIITAAAWVLLGGLSLLGCGPMDAPGAAEVAVATSALSTTDIVRVNVEIGASNITPAISQDLVKAGNNWKGTIGNIPAGSNRTFTVKAYNGSSTVVYYGTQSGVTISSGSTTTVVIVAQQQTAPTPFANTAPLISALTASGTQVHPLGTATLSVTASDADGDTLTYAWTATGGTFTGGTTAAPTWTAPATPGSYTLTVTVSDGNGGQNALSLVMAVQSSSTGNAAMSLTFNTWPVVTQVAATPGEVNVSQSTTLSITASDPDGDTLTYAWSDGACGGSFSSATSATPTWTAPASAPAGGACTLTATVSDSNGGSTTGAITIKVGAPTSAPNAEPVIQSTMQSDTYAAAGTTITFRVVAHDPEGTALTITWTAGAGTLGTPTTTSASGVYTSEVVWTAPISGASAAVTGTITDADTQKSAKTFNVTLTSSYTVQEMSFSAHVTAHYASSMAGANSGAASIYTCDDSNDYGRIFHYDGTSWTNVSSASTTRLMALDYIGSVATTEQVMAVGMYGKTYHYNGSSWSSLSTSTTETLTAVDWISGATALAAGVNGAIQRFNVGTWQAVSSGTTEDLNAVRSFGGGWRVVGDNQTILSCPIGGGPCSAVTPPVSITGDIADFRYHLGGFWYLQKDGKVTHDPITGPDVSWSLPALASGEYKQIIALSDTNVWVVGSLGAIHHFDGTTWAQVNIGTTNSMFSVWGRTVASEVYVGSSNKKVYKITW